MPLQPTSVKGEFVEQFTDDWETRWKPSHAKKDTAGKDDEEEWAYVGEWSVEEPTQYKGIAGDKGLVIKNPAAHHAISAKFPKKVDNKGKTLVVQYEVKLQSKFQARSLVTRSNWLTALRRGSRVRWCLPEAPPRQQGSSPGGVQQHHALRHHVRS